MKTNDSESGVLSIRDKIRQAHALYDSYADELRNDPGVRALSEKLITKVAASGKVMAEVGIVDTCRVCDEEEGGSCCGAGIENHYKASLLLVNLLWGEALPGERLWENSCYFLGRGGCSLKARHVLCINYLCTRIHNSLAHEDLLRLQSTTGDEMETIFLLHEAIKKVISR